MNASKIPIPILGFCAYSGTGKTTLLTQLIPALTKRGIILGVIKHAHHNFDVDKEGKDSYKLRKAGAKKMLVSSSNRWVLMNENLNDTELTLDQIINRISDDGIDLILVEGFKHESFNKIELHRKAVGKDPMYPSDPYVIAFATDEEAPADCNIPVLDLNDIPSLCDFIVGYLDKR